MKKLCSLLLALVMVLSLAACGSETTGNNDAPESTAPAQQTRSPAQRIPRSRGW